MIRPLWAVAGIAVLGTAGAAGAAIVTSSGGEEEVVQQVETATPASPTTSATPVASPEAPLTATPIPTTAGPTTTYVDPISGFSFDYPAGWFAQAPALDPAVQAYTVTVSSYNVEKARAIGVSPPREEIKIDIGVEPNPDGLTVQQWVEQRLAGPNEGVVTISEEPSTVDGETAVKRTVSIQETTIIQHLFGHDGRMYSLTAYTAESLLIGQFDEIVSSFKFP